MEKVVATFLMLALLTRAPDLLGSSPLEGDEIQEDPRTNIAHVPELPDEGWCQVAKWLKAESLKNFRLTCRRFARVGFDKDVLRHSRTFILVKTKEGLPLMGQKFDYGVRVSVQARFFLDADLTHLAHVTDLELMSGVGLTDAGLACLKNARRLVLLYCIKITDAGIAHLEKVTFLCLIGCKMVSQEMRETLRMRGVRVIG